MQFFLFGMWSALYAYTPELYPTRIRATGTGFASAVGRIGSLIGPYVIGIILPTAVATLPVWRMLSRTLDASPHAQEIARRFDLLAFQDLAAAFERQSAAIGMPDKGIRIRE